MYMGICFYLLHTHTHIYVCIFAYMYYKQEEPYTLMPFLVFYF